MIEEKKSYQGSNYESKKKLNQFMNQKIELF